MKGRKILGVKVCCALESSRLWRGNSAGVDQTSRVIACVFASRKLETHHWLCVKKRSGSEMKKAALSRRVDRDRVPDGRNAA